MIYHVSDAGKIVFITISLCRIRKRNRGECLKNYIMHKKIDDKNRVLAFLVKQMWSKDSCEAYGILKDKAQTEKFDDVILIDLITMIDMLGEQGKDAEEIVTLYWSNNGLGKEVIETLIEKATSDNVNGEEKRSFDLLKKIVNRDGLDDVLMNSFFEKASASMGQEMDGILMNKYHVSMLEAEDDVWRDFCEITEEINVDAQGGMSEKQYDIFITTGHHLKEEATHMILCRLTEGDEEFFKKVLNAAIAKDAISDRTARFLTTVKWKRELTVKLIAQHEKNNKK